MLQLEADLEDPRYRNESNFETSKADGFADDNSSGTLCTFESLSSLKKILTEFAVFSGLKCNADKTVLMQIGNKIPVSQEIKDLGFTFDKKIKILGMEIDADLNELDKNFENVSLSIKKSIGFWERLNLSLPGRINVIKSLLFSQIIYLGSFIMPSKERLNEIQRTLDNFAKGSLNVARNKITLPTEHGGLGLFNVEEFLTAQQCVWVFRANFSTRDNWRVRLRQLCNGNVLAAGPNLIDKEANPILYGLATAFGRLRTSHDTMNENFVHALVFNNPIFFRARGDKKILNATYLELDEGSASKISNLTALQCFNVNGLKTRQELCQTTGINLNLTGYARLGTCLSHYVSRMKAKTDNDGSKKSLYAAIGRLKKPGLKIRELLLKKRKKPFDLSKQTQTTTFAKVSGSVIPANDTYGFVISVWSKNALPNRLRTFLFKFYNNILGLNTRVSHFDNNVSRKCTLCSINQQSNFNNGTVPVPIPVPDETFKHVFADCPVTVRLHTAFIDEFFTGITFVNVTDRLNFFFQGRLNDGQNYNLFIHAAVMAFQYCIWEMKLKKRLLSFESSKIEFMEILLGFFYMNKDARTTSQKYNFPLCRLVNRLPLLPRARPAWTPDPLRPVPQPAQLRPPSPPPLQPRPPTPLPGSPTLPRQPLRSPPVQPAIYLQPPHPTALNNGSVPRP
jgi:hypothetical protein